MIGFFNIDGAEVRRVTPIVATQGWAPHPASGCPHLGARVCLPDDAYPERQCEWVRGYINEAVGSQRNVTSVICAAPKGDT